MAIDLIERNPRLKAPVACVLGLVSDGAPHARRDIERAALEAWSESYSQEPATIIDVVVRAGAVSESLAIDGEPYEGSLEDIQLDESIPLEAEVSDTIVLTDAGRELAASLDPANTLRDLFDARPHYKKTFMRVLSACSSQKGASREALESAIEANGPVKSPEGERVYPQFFLDALESAGGIAWDGTWRATDAGRQFSGAA